MPNKELEKALREQLHHHPSPVDTEATWKAVEARLGKKKRRGGIIWWIPGLLLAVLVGGYAWAGFRLNEELHNPAVKDTEKIEVSLPAEIPAPRLEPFATPASPAPLPASRVTASSSPSASAPSPSLAQKSGTATGSPETPASKTTFIRLNAKTQSTTPENLVTAIDEASLIDEELPVLAATALLPSAAISPLPDRFYDPATPPFSELKGPTDCPVFIKSRPAGWELAARGTYSQIQRQLSAVSEMAEGQRDRNLQVESPLEAISAEVLLGYRTANNFTLRTGLGITRINSVARFAEDTSEIRTIESVTEIIINSTGDTTFIFGEVESVVRFSRFAEYYNRLTTIDLPILLGKTFTRDRWSLALEAGPVFNLRSRGSARYQLADLSFSERDAAAFSFRPRLVGVGWQGNASIAYRLLPKLDVSLGLRAHRFPSTGVEEDLVGVKTNYTLYGGTLGLGWRF